MSFILGCEYFGVKIKKGEVLISFVNTKNATKTLFLFKLPSSGEDVNFHCCCFARRLALLHSLCHL